MGAKQSTRRPKHFVSGSSTLDYYRTTGTGSQAGVASNPARPATHPTCTTGSNPTGVTATIRQPNVDSANACQPKTSGQRTSDDNLKTHPLYAPGVTPSQTSSTTSKRPAPAVPSESNTTVTKVKLSNSTGSNQSSKNHLQSIDISGKNPATVQLPITTSKTLATVTSKVTAIPSTSTGSILTVQNPPQCVKNTATAQLPTKRSPVVSHRPQMTGQQMLLAKANIQSSEFYNLHQNKSSQQNTPGQEGKNDLNTILEEVSYAI